MNDIEKLLFKKALCDFGTDAQITMVFEEMSELQKELCKRLRGKDNVNDIAEKIADVEIMLDQMKLLFNIAPMVSNYRSEKVARLSERLGVQL